MNLLDVGCGTGRHAIELTRRGYNITGIDLSEAQLVLAKEKAREAGLTIPPFLQADARNLPFKTQFDGGAIMLYEGGFPPLMETDEENASILSSVAGALKHEYIHFHHAQWPLYLEALTQ